MVTFPPILTCTATSAPEEHPHRFHPIGTSLSLQSGTLCSEAVCASQKCNTQGWEDSSVGRVLAMQTQGLVHLQNPCMVAYANLGQVETDSFLGIAGQPIKPNQPVPGKIKRLYILKNTR